MGIIEEGRNSFNQDEDARRAAGAEAKAAQIDTIMGGFGDTLTSPKYVGDIDLALIHHMGRAAFDDEEFTKPYIDLSRVISAEHQRTGDAIVPVILLFHNYDETGAKVSSSTAFVKAKPTDSFMSEKMRSEQVMHTYAGSMVDGVWQPDTEMVTQSTLSLHGKTTIFSGNIMHLEGLEKYKSGSKLTLSERNVADNGRGGGMPSPHAFTNFNIERLDEEEAFWVGWPAIDSLMARQFSFLTPNAQSEALLMYRFFKVIGEYGKLDEKVPSIATIIRAAGTLERSLGRMAV
jgi:hypothetical protein